MKTSSFQMAVPFVGWNLGLLKEALECNKRQLVVIR